MKDRILKSLLAISLVASSIYTASGQNPTQQPRPRTVTSATSSAQDPNSKPVSEPQPDVIRVDTNLVNTLFTAVDKDRHFITSLRAEDIRIFENDVTQPITLFERETDRPLSLAILIDTSESQRGVLSEEKRSAQAFIDMVIRPKKDHAAIISFTGVPKLEQSLTSDLGKLRTGIEHVRIELSPENARRLANGLDPLPKDEDPSGYTGIWDAMWATIENHISKAPEGTRRAVILLSDGDDTSSTIKRQNVIELAVKSDVVVYAIGIRDEEFPEGKLDSGALKKVTGQTGGRAFFPKLAEELKLAFAQIDQELRSQYNVGYTPTNANRDGSYRRIRIEVVNPELQKNKVRLQYREGYYARKN
ncbi:MAG TPA: VWA domain-containing protein [Pyrinomonadaceae bacterium]|nr:VWA domain-containing protein [Pyrinomonadaceae bacterium]